MGRTECGRKPIAVYMISGHSWRRFWFATHLDPQNDWIGWQNRVNYDVFAETPLRFKQRESGLKFTQTSQPEDGVDEEVSVRFFNNFYVTLVSFETQ